MCIIITSKKKMAERDAEIRKMYERDKHNYTDILLDYNMKASVRNLNSYLELEKSAVIKKVFINKQGVLSFVIMIPSGNYTYDFYVISSEISHCGKTMSEHPCLMAKMLKDSEEIEIIDILSKDYKRRGYGRAMMSVLFEFASDNNVKAISGKLSSVDEIDPYNKKARDSFYKVMGFEFQGDRVIKEIKA